jgi:hypothetical protein
MWVNTEWQPTRTLKSKVRFDGLIESFTARPGDQTDGLFYRAGLVMGKSVGDCPFILIRRSRRIF